MVQTCYPVSSTSQGLAIRTQRAPEFSCKAQLVYCFLAPGGGAAAALAAGESPVPWCPNRNNRRSSCSYSLRSRTLSQISFVSTGWGAPYTAACTAARNLASSRPVRRDQVGWRRKVDTATGEVVALRERENSQVTVSHLWPPTGQTSHENDARRLQQT